MEPPGGPTWVYNISMKVHVCYSAEDKAILKMGATQTKKIVVLKWVLHQHQIWHLSSRQSAHSANFCIGLDRIFELALFFKSTPLPTKYLGTITSVYTCKITRYTENISD